MAFVKLRHLTLPAIGGAFRRYASCALIIPMMACSPSQTSSSDAWTGEILPATDSATKRVSIDARLLRTPPIALQPSVVIGTGKRGPNDEFGWVAGIATDAAGRIFVSDPMSSRVRVYDAKGNFSRDIGRKGKGPGEFWGLHGDADGRGVNGIAFTGDTLFALDEHMIALDTAGNYLFASEELPFSDAIGITAGQNKLVVSRHKIEQDQHFTFAFSEYDPASKREVPGFSIQEATIDFEKKGLLYRKPTPLTLLVFAVNSNNRIYMVDGDSFNVTVITPNGTVERVYVATVPRVKATKRDLKDVGEDLQEMIGGRLKLRNMPDYARMIAKGPKWEYRQAIGGIVVSNHNALLLQRLDISENPYNRFTPGPGIVWALIDSAGRPLGNYLLPKQFRAKSLVDCMLYGLDDQNDGAQAVVVYDMARSGPHRLCY